MTRKSIREKVRERDEAFISNEANSQALAGATHIDINAGGNPAREIEDMIWLTKTVSEEVKLPLCYDSTNAEAIEAGLEICNRPGTIINSITMERKRVDEILPLVKKFDTGVVCLTMSDEGMPEDYEGRIEITDNIVALFKENTISIERIYFDHLVRPASTNPGQVKFILDAITSTRKSYPDTHFALGLSNVSYGIPCRNNFNKAFLAMLVAVGCDGFILDPTEKEMMLTLYSARAVLGQDEYCIEYITKMRKEGKA
jgi:5-methyltetrahydrofolate--homocysteine methyltransferase